MHRAFAGGTLFLVLDVVLLIPCAAVVFVGHAGAEAGSERQAAVRVFGEVVGQQESCRAGGHQVPPVSRVYTFSYLII